MFDDLIVVGNKAKFRKVKEIRDNETGDFIKKGVFYKITGTKFKKEKAFTIKDEKGFDFYISFTEHHLIKEIKEKK